MYHVNNTPIFEFLHFEIVSGLALLPPPQQFVLTHIQSVSLPLCT